MSWVSGDVKTTLTVSNGTPVVPTTGDNTPVCLLGVVMLVSAAAAILLLNKRRA